MQQAEKDAEKDSSDKRDGDLRGGDTADFGFKTVEKDKKVHLVHEVFSSVSRKYDLMNDLMSMGLHRLWKRRMVEMMRPFEGVRMLDVAGGTGDISFRFLQRAERKAVQDVHITVCDINENMLQEGQVRAVDKNILSRIEWQVGNAEKLPFEDGIFDYCTIAFGIRNVTDIPQALREMYRVLKPGGKLVCLEFSSIDSSLLAKVYDEYSFRAIPEIGKIVTGDRDSYQYLVESIRKFPDKESFAKMIEQAGFARVKFQPLTHGVVAIHSGWRV